MKILILFLLCLLTPLPATAGEPLKIGLLLIEDAVPFYVAEQENLFRRHGVDVELIPFLSALERDSALAAGAIDGAVSDPVGAILFDRGRGLIKITSLCLGKTPEEGVFAILAAPGSGIERVEQLKKVEIAVSNATIIEYVTDRLLAARGFAESEIRKIEVKKMPIRMQMLISGSVKAATLPEPLASIASGRGAKVLVTDGSVPESLSQTVVVFRSEALKRKKRQIESLFKAYASGIEAINDNPEKYRKLFVEKGRIPPFLARDYPIPTYPEPAPFSKSLYDPVIEWLKNKRLVNDLPYQQMVATDFMEEQG